MSFHNWEAVIGLEIHAQLKTKSKMFCSDSTEFGQGDNDNTSPVSLGMPGALPVVNQEAINLSIKTGLALGCEIRNKSVFSRKNYYYADLPKGYQISQYDKPLCEHGKVEFLLNDKKYTVGVTRAHMEEDAGKSIHHGDYSLINLNRAGIPLLEIVSEPDMRTPQEAAEYARTVRRILRYLDVCDGNLEEGSLRCDCNVSIREKGEVKLGTKVEIKNINSFRFVEKAIEFEIKRQITMKENGETIHQETRLYDHVKNVTQAMRSKEEAHDYRYFPDPDLLPTYVSNEDIQNLKSSLPELPLAKAERFQNEMGLPDYDSFVLTQEKEMAEYFEKVAKLSGNPKLSSNWIMGEVLRVLKESKLEFYQCPISVDNLAKLILLIDKNTISGKIAKTVFSEMWVNNQDPYEIIENKGLSQITDEKAIEKLIDDVLISNPNQLEQYRSGKEKLFGFFVGQAMKVSKGQASPDLLNKILKQKLKG
jgi:aspartyl-tRNA(Asn)/glutamyl-tRNA(Gln) amidotransferase subunit B